MAEKRDYVCSGCGEARQSERCPPGWKDVEGRKLCGKCMKGAYRARAIELPIAGPEGDEPDGWKQLREALVACWRTSTALANWGARELFRREVVRGPGMEKLPAMEKVDLYNVGFTRKQYPYWRDWAGVTPCAGAILRRVEAAYKKSRFAVVWQGEESPCHYKFPYPWLVPAADWKAEVVGERKKLVVAMKLPGGVFRVRLRGGPEFRHQVDVFRQIAAGELKVGEAMVYRKKASSSCHRRTVKEKVNGGGVRRYREMVKLVVWLPRNEKGGRGEECLLLRTDPQAFWVAEMKKRMGRPWILNADQVRQWVVDHDRYRQRLGEDLKFEKRWPARKRKRINKAREDRCKKNRRRINSWCKEAAAMLANYARRRGVGEVVYDDQEKSYLPHFPWYALQTALKNKLEDYGITLIVKEKKTKKSKEGEDVLAACDLEDENDEGTEE